MHCSNCGQALPEGASVCPSCGAPVLSSPVPQVSPMPYAPPAPAPPMPASSGLSTASLVLGILAIVALVIFFALYMALLMPLINTAGAQPTADDLESLLQGPEMLGLSALFVFSMLLALIGLILGIIGVVQERKRPTRSGKVMGIVGIVLSILPLLCCVTSLMIGALTLAGAS